MTTTDSSSTSNGSGGTLSSGGGSGISSTVSSSSSSSSSRLGLEQASGSSSVSAASQPIAAGLFSLPFNRGYKPSSSDASTRIAPSTPIAPPEAVASPQIMIASAPEIASAVVKGQAEAETETGNMINRPTSPSSYSSLSEHTITTTASTSTSTSISDVNSNDAVEEQEEDFGVDKKSGLLRENDRLQQVMTATPSLSHTYHPLSHTLITLTLIINPPS